jgi:hypothetical protein
MPYQLNFITQMPHNLYTNYSHATPLLEAIQRNLLGSFRALLARNCNAGDASNAGDAGNAGNAGTGDPRTGGGCAFAFALALALALALACSTKGANSLSNSELDSLLLDISLS